MDPNSLFAQWLRYIARFLLNVVLAYAIFMLCRVVYVLENWTLFADGWDRLSTGLLLTGSLRFDTAAMGYLLSLWMIVVLFPLPLSLRRTRPYQLIAKWLYFIPVTFAIIANLSDAVYSQFTGRRTTSTFFNEFSNDSNLTSILANEILNHWYLVLVGIVLIAAAWFLYRTDIAKQPTRPTPRQKWLFLLIDTLLLALMVALTIGGIRGGFSKATRPIANIDANTYVNSPQQAAIVLNTPFSFLRTQGKSTFVNPHYFDDNDLNNLYSPLHPAPSSQPMTNKRNVVVLIVESFGANWFGSLNNYQGYTPFLDSLIAQSLTFEQSYANGRKSIDAMPSILSSIPMFVEPFFTTNYSLNHVEGLASYLGREGYTSAFFHGAINGSMGFEGFASSIGYDRYYGRTEYDKDPRFEGAKDFDGTWAIWDEPYLQYFALHTADLPEPFLATIFTASSHHPFRIPQKYYDSLHVDGHPMRTCIRYTDMALRRYFETASQQPWYQNTLFVITADHTSIIEDDYNKTDLGRFRVPIIFFDPSGTLFQPQQRPGIAQQADIMPTTLSLLNYNHPYFAFGLDLLTTSPQDTWGVNFVGGIYQLEYNHYFLQFDGNNITAFYDHAADPLLQHNLKDDPSLATTRTFMLNHLKAIIQSYMQRMIDDQMTADE